jgi:hypothetical protein
MKISESAARFAPIVEGVREHGDALAREAVAHH